MSLAIAILVAMGEKLPMAMSQQGALKEKSPYLAYMPIIGWPR